MSEPIASPSTPNAALLGCIADDVTGATDLALNLVQGGMRVVQWLGIPTVDELLGIDADAIVVALKSRSIPADDAIQMSLEALGSLQAAGCRRFYFKYCSTFDSTDAGNIGPVAEALMSAVSAEQAIFCPAFPDAGRTVYAGHLFVDTSLLNESGMQDHPLNPMHDACLLRVLAKQSQQAVGLVAFDDVTSGPEAIRERLKTLQDAGQNLVIVDALNEWHLRSIAVASVDAPLVTGGSGLARYLPEAYRAHGMLATEPFTPPLATVGGRSAILSGSCSRATQSQVAKQRGQCASHEIDVAGLMQQPENVYRKLIAWVEQQPADAPLMVYSTAAPDQVSALQQQFGREHVAQQVENLQACFAKALVDDYGVRRLIVAGGETSAAVAEALGIRALRIGPEIAPGVPWTESLGKQSLALAFKSGNFGSEDFFQRALEMLE